MLAEPLEGAPGAGFRYSNSNYQLAAAILEVVSGTSYARFVEDNLWGPVGLADTGFSGPETSSTVSPAVGKLPERLLASHWGEQGLFSSARDLFRSRQALRTGKLLSEASLTELFSPILPIGEGQSALGWFIGTSAAGSRMVFTRGNDDFGANSLIYDCPDQSGVERVVWFESDVQLLKGCCQSNANLSPPGEVRAGGVSLSGEPSNQRNGAADLSMAATPNAPYYRAQV